MVCKTEGNHDTEQEEPENMERKKPGKEKAEREKTGEEKTGREKIKREELSGDGRERKLWNSDHVLTFIMEK